MEDDDDDDDMYMHRYAKKCKMQLSRRYPLILSEDCAGCDLKAIQARWRN